MDGFEGGQRPGIESELKSGGLPESYDHRGIWFKSPEADALLSETRDRTQSERSSPSIYDLITIVRAEKNDIAKQKDGFIGDKKKFGRSEKELDAIQDTLVDLAAGQGDAIPDEQREQVTTYLKRQEARWENKWK